MRLKGPSPRASPLLGLGSSLPGDWELVAGDSWPSPHLLGLSRGCHRTLGQDSRVPPSIYPLCKSLSLTRAAKATMGAELGPENPPNVTELKPDRPQQGCPRAPCPPGYPHPYPTLRVSQLC